MSRDLNYFDEFLADPAKYEFDEFHRMAKEWGRYILDHEGEFNYLEDDEWKEVRDRLLDVFYAREREMNEIENDWDEIAEAVENAAKLSESERIKLYKRQIQFMKEYKYYFNFKEEDIEELSAKLASFAASAKEIKMLNLQIKLKKIDYEKSVAVIDDGLFEHYERTGKILKITTHPPIKKHRGN